MVSLIEIDKFLVEFLALKNNIAANTGDWNFGAVNLTTTGDVTTSKLNVTNTGTDADIIFTGNLNSATLRYESDNDRFVFGKDLKMLTASEIQFRSLGQNIGSSATGVLDISADTSIDIATPLLDLGSGDLETTGEIDTKQLNITQDSDTEATGIVMFNPHTFLPPDATESISISAKFANTSGTATDGGKIDFHAEGDYIVDMNKTSRIDFYVASGGTDTLALELTKDLQANFKGTVFMADNLKTIYGINDMNLSSDGTNGIIDVGTSVRIGNAITNYAEIGSTGNLKFVGSAEFHPPRVSQSAQPTPSVGELMVWRDTDDNKTYLVYNDTDEGVRKTEMT